MGLQTQRICHRKLEPVKPGHVVLVKHSPEWVYQQTTRSDKKVSHNHPQHTPNRPGNDRAMRQQKGELHQLFIALVDFGTKWQILQFCLARSLLHHLLVLVQLLQILAQLLCADQLKDWVRAAVICLHALERHVGLSCNPKSAVRISLKYSHLHDDNVTKHMGNWDKHDITGIYMSCLRLFKRIEEKWCHIQTWHC